MANIKTILTLFLLILLFDNELCTFLNFETILNKHLSRIGNRCLATFHDNRPFFYQRCHVPADLNIVANNSCICFKLLQVNHTCI